MERNLQQTMFHIEKIRTVVNVRGRSAYQIITYPGKQLGRFGKITDASLPTTANDSEFQPQATPAETVSRRIRKVLAALKS